MTTFKCVLGLLALSSALATGADEGAHLANERTILPGDVDAWKGSTVFDSQKGIIKLSPDGKRLLHYRPEQMDANGRNQRVFRLVLRDLTDGSETILPVPAYPERFIRLYANGVLSHSPGLPSATLGYATPIGLPYPNGVASSWACWRCDGTPLGYKSFGL